MIIISYRSPTITISLSLSMRSQIAMQASTCCIPRNQEHISYRNPVLANFLLKFTNFRCHGNQGRSGARVNDTIGFAAIENPHLVQESGTYLQNKPSYSQFSVKIFKFSLPWQQGVGLRQISLTQLNSPTPKTP